MDRNPYTEHNVQVIKVGIKRHLETTGRRMILDMLRQVAERMVNMIDGAFTPAPPYEPGGNKDFPVWRGHMHDATGVAIYDEGKVTSFIPTRKCIKTQSYHGKIVIGPKALADAISHGATTFSKGLWIVLFSAVPYGYVVNTFGSPWGRGVGYFDTLSDDFFQDILMGLKAINP